MGKILKFEKKEKEKFDVVGFARNKLNESGKFDFCHHCNSELSGWFEICPECKNELTGGQT